MDPQERKKKRRERLKQHPDTVTINLSGEEMYWNLGHAAFDLAKQRAGLEPDEVLGLLNEVQSQRQGAADQKIEEEQAFGGMGQLAGMLDKFGRFVWVGCLPIQPDLEEEDVLYFLTLGDLTRLMPKLASSMAGGMAEDASTEELMELGRESLEKSEAAAAQGGAAPSADAQPAGKEEGETPPG